ncbi:MAG: mechanosensitive ion channel family protein [Candidatus Accumulibacter phosphatis]|uniref:mechanosensitive ion channel family protein n=1 Tax=Accumulibacter sp. TaxID=2053492 RepID=UPI0006252F04|nr:mechanosensitive ion channel domain-containing protein [Accumulibacter sp.]MCC2867045.1 mechanosensitive ion channel family protein [Candidatus Accumulibacter phosphatis]MBL8399866.1 mechanosensitive ion channel [Accumulibacter sp.]MCM8621744.1 mechanosensitive ion channel family protein [Accumulibacter sp.]MCQ1548239.1 mechanosensitive ion channel family protein [Candidatus Accumulibacter phosphatis]HMW54603.1 mechanosensitive ion channel [Accumulibacter sp.]
MWAIPLLSKLSATLSWLLCCLFLASTGAPVIAAESAHLQEATLHYHFRPIVTFRTTLMGMTPETRVRRALARLDTLAANQMGEPVEVTPFTVDGKRGINLRIGQLVLFNVLEGDLDPEEKLSIDETGRRAASEMQAALQAAREQNRPMVLLKGAGLSILATAIALLLLWLIRRATTLMVRHLQVVIEAENASSRLHWARHGWLLVQRLAQLLMGFLWLNVAYLWLTYVLARFPLTEPLGDRLTDFLFGLLETLGAGLLDAMPALTTALVILFLTKAFNDALGNFFKAAKEGRVQVPGLHPETVTATHRLVNILVWGLGIAIAYPFIPMSDSDAFKGLSVMFGFMLTLGSAGIVNQLMSGLVLVYSRALSVGDFVDIGEHVGVVSEVGALSTKMINMRNEEVTIPNAVLVGNPIRNYSRLAGARGTLVSTKVTIGYDTPWRQVHAMLIAAAEQTPGLRALPKPFVYQRSLADWYVEYELFAHMDKPLERVPVLSALHANIQDQFNTYGVQIMSPHFVSQPRNNVVVPPEGWHAPPAAPDAPPPQP